MPRLGSTDITEHVCARIVDDAKGGAIPLARSDSHAGDMSARWVSPNSVGHLRIIA
jgi:hypothetical protein